MKAIDTSTAQGFQQPALGKKPHAQYRLDKLKLTLKFLKEAGFVSPAPGLDGSSFGTTKPPVVRKQHTFKITKGNQPHIVIGVVYEPDAVDAHDEYADGPTIYTMAHKFMAEFQNLNLMHAVPLERRQAAIVESYIAPCDFQMGGQTVKIGSWVLAAEIYDPYLWKAIESGEITGWSLEGLAAYGEGA